MDRKTPLALLALALATVPPSAAAARHHVANACPLPHAFTRLAQDEMDDYDAVQVLVARFLRGARDPYRWGDTVSEDVMEAIGMPDHTPGHPRLIKLPDGLALVSGLDPEEPDAGSAILVDTCGHVLGAAYMYDFRTKPPKYKIRAYVDEGRAGDAHLSDVERWWPVKKYPVLVFRLH